MDKFVIRGTKDNSKTASSGAILSTPVSKKTTEPNQSESSVSISSDSEAETATKKEKRTRLFRDQWAADFKWVENNKGSAFCKVCETRLTNIKSYLLRHDTNVTHKKNMEVFKLTPIDVAFANPARASLEKQAKEAELILVMFCLMHHLPFALLDFLPNLLQPCCPDSKIATNIKCGRTEAHLIVKNILGEKGRQEVATQLRNEKFSIIIDETTDISTAKALALVARVFDKKRGMIRDRFLGMLQLVKTDAASIYAAIVNHFEILNIPLSNLIGLASDNAAVMSGQITGVQARFKEVVPNLFFMNCICHSLHLCASNACQKLPYSVEQLARYVLNFFAHSSKRCSDLQEFQNYFSIKPHKILGLTQTRWLSLEMVVNRILEQWDALQLNFVSCAFEDRGARNIATNLVEQLGNPINKLYFMFLSYSLRIVNKMNLEFQSEQIRIHTLFHTMETNFKLTLSNFINPNCFRNLATDEIDFYEVENHLSLRNISMGSAIETFLLANNLGEDELNTFLENVKQFYIELAKQVKNRFDFSNHTFQHFSLINPENICSENVCLTPLLNAFPNLLANNNQKDEILDEFKLLTISSHLNHIDKKNVEEFWSKVGLIKGIDGYLFQNLSNFMISLMSLPDSSAAAERIFSDLNQTKHKKTNRLLMETADSMMAAKELLTLQKKNPLVPIKLVKFG